MENEISLVLNTCPSEDVGNSIAGMLVDEKLAACVNIVPGVTSVYMWEGERVVDKEVLLVIKTRAELVPAISERIQSEHPYELPEVVAVPITGGLPAYLSWVKEQVEIV